MGVFCNPVNINYRYQFIKDPNTGAVSVSREAADPSMILFRGRYYIYASMTLGVWSSDDLITWENHRLPDELPLYDYAPDARVIGDKVIICASRRDGVCDYYQTEDPLNGPYKRIPGSFAFWDPNLFRDDDERIYFYWGCSSEEPVCGVEVDPETLQPVGEIKKLITGDPFTKGFERIGEDHCTLPRTEEEIDLMVREFCSGRGIDPVSLPPETMSMIRGMFSQKPFIEGAWMTKYQNRYYLQYACPGTEYNTYADAVYVGEEPLGPFRLAENNPYSYHPGGFMLGAGHGSTMWDKDGRLWHASTMRISINHNFERRVGIWRAGFDQDGELFCNQRYGDWPTRTDAENPWEDPEWFLLSFQKTMTASTSLPGYEPENAADENVQTWWQAASASRNEWIEIDLGSVMDVRAVQINFADSKLDLSVPGDFHNNDRCIEERQMYTQWLLEGSADGRKYQVLEDKTRAQTDLPHDFLTLPEGMQVRYLRLGRFSLPYGQAPCVSGFRVFGRGCGQLPQEAEFTVERVGEMDAEIQMHAQGAVGYNVLWGTKKDKLYHSYMSFQPTVHIGALQQGKNYYVRVDTFNENGIKEGQRIVLI